MAKIVLIGAGSGFGTRLSIDVMCSPLLRNSTLCLCDIHPGRLRFVTDYVRRTAEKHRIPVRIISGTNRKALLPGADFVITSISAGGGAYYGHPYMDEVQIPRKFGVDQSVADTCSAGAVFRFLRTGPVQQQILRDVERFCPDAYVLNHTNPMAMLTWLHTFGSSVRNVGLCHGVQHTALIFSNAVGVPVDTVRYKVAGINHLAWFLEFSREGEDLYPRIRKIAVDPSLSADPSFYRHNKVRIEIMKHFGYFSTESARHDSEYMPYFRRTPEMITEFGLISPEVRLTPPSSREWEMEGKEGGPSAEKLVSSQEYTTGIMEGILTDKPFRFNGNVMNTGLITNLPLGCCVEVPCIADSHGITPGWIGDLPPQLAALNRSNIAVQELAVKAVLEKDPEAAFHACCLDPLTAAVLPLSKIRAMFEELWEAEKQHLLWFDPSYTGDLPETCAE